MKRIMWSVRVMVAVLAAVLGVTRSFAAETPAAIRIGLAGNSYGKPFANGTIGFVQARGLLEEEFAKEGIRIEYNFLKGTGPAVNEALANGSLDFGLSGDLPVIAGRAGGLKTRLVAVSGRGGNTYVVVPSDSRIASVEGLRGKKVGVAKGTYLHAALVKILQRYGLGEKDVKLYSMDSATLKTAIATKDIDAAAITSDAFELRSRGVARIIYSTKTDSAWFRNAGGVSVREDFAKKYPDVVRRFVKVYVQGAHLASLNRDESLKLWTRSGTPLASQIEENEGKDLSFITSPVFDEHFLTHFSKSIVFFKELGLIRKTFELEEWIDRSYLDAALKELKLEDHWPQFDANGEPKHRA